ncbi:MAG TPA: hypothetical protein VKU83_06945 [Puia sp.]|nr:hypothetical protein [Puia sp.]
MESPPVRPLMAAGSKARWIYRKTRDGKPWHLRGVDQAAAARAKQPRPAARSRDRRQTPALR